eukprot:scaffold1221_cov207-Amphora_coffeaeformis.AAC.56
MGEGNVKKQRIRLSCAAANAMPHMWLVVGAYAKPDYIEENPKRRGKHGDWIYKWCILNLAEHLPPPLYQTGYK